MLWTALVLDLQKREIEKDDDLSEEQSFGEYIYDGNLSQQRMLKYLHLKLQMLGILKVMFQFGKSNFWQIILSSNKNSENG